MKGIKGLIEPGLLNIILADDDKDDCFLFEEALRELSIPANLTIVPSGVQLIQLLSQQNKPAYNILFLDLNMPQKNGFTCLEEIRADYKLKQLSVIIMSTTNQADSIDLLHTKGANFYICKPSSFLQLKNVIHQAIILSANKNNQPTHGGQFIIGTTMDLNNTV